MSTKDEFLKSKQKPIMNNQSDNGQQYSNITLSKNQQCPLLIPVQTFSKSSGDKLCNASFELPDSVLSDKKEEMPKPWNKSSKTSVLATLNDEVEREDKKRSKRDSSSTCKNSTLSLHIAAHENSEGDESISIDGKSDEENEKSGSIKNNETTTQILADPTSLIQKPFEFPRQKSDNAQEPEVSQFRASQRLLNTNEPSISNRQKAMEVSYRSAIDEIANKAKDSGGSNYAYTREEMLRIKKTPLAQERPGYLSVEFNDDKGLFAPDKWFDHTFAHDTHNKTVARTKKILSRGEEELGLSPQRRQFAGGCVPGSTNKSEQGNTKIWRNGKSGNRDDIKNDTNRWKHNKDNDKRDNRQRSHTSHTEELPEWMESKISVNDVIELKGFDNHNTESSTQKPKEIPLTAPKLDELQLLQEIQRTDSSASNSQPASGGSRFISFFKSKQENQQHETPMSFNSENIRRQEDIPKSSNLNDLFGANQVWPEMPVSAGVLASDIEKRMHAVDIKGDSPTLLPELINTIRNPPEVHIKGLKPMNRSSEQPKWEDDIIASLLPKHDVFIGKEKQEPKVSEDSKHIHHQQNIHQQNDRQSIHQQNNRQGMPTSSIWDSKFSSDFMDKNKDDRNDLHDMIHGLHLTPDLSYYEANLSKNEGERSISPPHQPPPPHMYADTSGPSRSSPAPPPPPPSSMLPPFGRMPFPNMHMPNNGMPPMMRFPFYPPFPMMNPQMGPNGVPLHPPSSPQNNSPNVTHGGNLPTSVLLRMKSQNSSSANSQRSLQSPDTLRRENNLSSPLISDMPQTSGHREGSVTNSDNESNSNMPSSSNMFPRNPNNIDPNMFYNMMMAQTMMNMPGMPPGMHGMPPFPPNMPGFHGMPPMPPGMMPPFGPGVPPPFFPPGMPPSSEHPNSISPMFDQVRQEQPSIPESILRQLPSSARPLTVADLERNLLSKN